MRTRRSKNALTGTLRTSSHDHIPICSDAARRFISGFRLMFFLCLAPAVSYADAGNCWTNRAGHALKATPQSIRGQTVTFAQGGAGKTVTYPLSVFTETEQERLRCALKDTSLPAGLADAFAFSCRMIKRSRLLTENGSLSEKDGQKALETTVSAFRTQAAPFIAQKQLSAERLELIVQKMVAE